MTRSFLLNYRHPIVALANLGYFGIEFAAALSSGSVSLFADSIAARSRVGMALALVRIDIILKTRRQKARLMTVGSLDKTSHLAPPKQGQITA